MARWGKVVGEVQLDSQPKQLILRNKLTVVFESKVEIYDLT